MRKLHLVGLAALLVASLGMAPATTSTDASAPASKTGFCVHIPRLQSNPLCVLVDPSE